MCVHNASLEASQACVLIQTTHGMSRLLEHCMLQLSAILSRNILTALRVSRLIVSVLAGIALGLLVIDCFLTAVFGAIMVVFFLNRNVFEIRARYVCRCITAGPLQDACVADTNRSHADHWVSLKYWDRHNGVKAAYYQEAGETHR